MNPVTHFLSGWVPANITPFNRRDRALVALSCVVPDVDGLGAIPEVLTKHSAHPLTWLSDYHHMLHNVAFALLVSVAAFALATRRWKTALFALLAFHVHLLEDVAGSRGPAHDYWAVPYLLPFSRVSWTWSGQWALNSWQNITLTILLLMITFWLAWARGYSPLEMVSTKGDAAFVDALRQRVAR
ncbi:MAG: metal-dependent hydrolase [Acidobacteriia bacterium]|nr:metal-dependent hydrolase [Terriglobia bacterium]